MRRLAAALLAAALLAGCGGGGERDDLVLDGSPRRPDAEGVLLEVSRERLVLDGGRRYRVSPEFRAFSTVTLEAVPVLQRTGQYVQIGLDGDTAVWLAAFSQVLPLDPPAVYYEGELEEVDGREAVFADGTVLRLGDGVDPPERGTRTRAVIDPARRVVRSFETAR